MAKSSTEKITELEVTLKFIREDLKDIKDAMLKNNEQTAKVMTEITKVGSSHFALKSEVETFIAAYKHDVEDRDSKMNLNTKFRERLQDRWKLIVGLAGTIGVSNVILILSYVVDLLKQS